MEELREALEKEANKKKRAALEERYSRELQEGKYEKAARTWEEIKGLK